MLHLELIACERTKGRLRTLICQTARAAIVGENLDMIISAQFWCSISCKGVDKTWHTDQQFCKENKMEKNLRRDCMLGQAA